MIFSWYRIQRKPRGTPNITQSIKKSKNVYFDKQELYHYLLYTQKNDLKSVDFDLKIYKIPIFHLSLDVVRKETTPPKQRRHKESWIVQIVQNVMAFPFRIPFFEIRDILSQSSLEFLVSFPAQKAKG